MSDSPMPRCSTCKHWTRNTDDETYCRNAYNYNDDGPSRAIMTGRALC